MRFFGWEIALRKAATPASLSPPVSRGTGGWVTLIHESFRGAFQSNVTVSRESVLTYFAVYACITRIASDIGKLRLKLVEKDDNGIWDEVAGASPFKQVLRKPNRYQTRQKFIEQYITSKLIYGNTYVLKQRDLRGIPVALYVLDPDRVTPLIAPDGAIYYRLQDDFLAQLAQGSVVVPASEIIHDTMVCLHHPLIGVSPLYACGLAAAQGLAIQNNSTSFFSNRSQPGGILMAPERISPETAKSVKDYWEANYTGSNVGKIAVLGDGLKYQQLAVTPVDAQLIEQLKLTAEQVCSAYHVPAFKVGVGPTPTYQNAEILNQIYYTDCLQTQIESFEAHMDEGLGLDKVTERTLGCELEIEDLLRMDTSSRVLAGKEAVGSGVMAPNEARKRWLNLKPVKGGETPYLQQQNYSLDALAKRDAMNPFAQPAATPVLPAPADADEDEDEDRQEEREAFYLTQLRKELGDAVYG